MRRPVRHSLSSEFMSSSAAAAAPGLVLARDVSKTFGSRKALDGVSVGYGDRAVLRRLNLPEALYDLPPATFSGGEKQLLALAAQLDPPTTPHAHLVA